MNDHTAHDEHFSAGRYDTNEPMSGPYPGAATTDDLRATAVHGQHGMAQTEHAGHGEHVGHAEGQPVGHVQHGPADAHAGHGEAMFSRPFRIALILTVPILLYPEPIEEQSDGLGHHLMQARDLLPPVTALRERPGSTSRDQDNPVAA